MTARRPDLVSGSVMRLRARCPFFAVLALHSRWIEKPEIGTAGTNGEDIWFNPEFLGDLKPAHRDFVVAHEVAHVALRHVTRIGSRDPMRWNVAADVVVNGMLIAMGLEMTPGGIRMPDLEHLRVEDVYARLGDLSPNLKRKLGVTAGSKLRDILPPPEGAGAGEEGAGAGEEGPAEGGSAQDAMWRTALQRAAVIQRLHGGGRGTDFLGVSRELDQVLDPQLDWRTLLWRFMVQTPTDYAGYDRRFIHRGQYIDALAGESLTVGVCIDTSGSIDMHMLRDFMAELQGILRAYPHIRVKLYFADMALYGPWWLDRDSVLPQPHGGGGTDLVPFFEAITEDEMGEDAVDLAVYQTDGYGPIPDEAPHVPVMWLVPEGAREDFPWGEVARLEVA
jgi:predicted metal-dependent peptidase